MSDFDFHSDSSMLAKPPPDCHWDFDAIPDSQRVPPMRAARVIFHFEVPESHPARVKLPAAFPAWPGIRVAVDATFNASQFSHDTFCGAPNLFCGQIYVDTWRPLEAIKLALGLATHFDILDFSRIGWRDDECGVWRGVHPPLTFLPYEFLILPTPVFLEHFDAIREMHLRAREQNRAVRESTAHADE